MGIANFFKSPDNLPLALTFFIFGVLLSLFWIKRRVGDIQKIQKRVIRGKAKKLKKIELIDFIDEVIKEDSKILMPTKSTNRFLYVTSSLFFLTAFCTTFYDALSKVFSWWPFSNDISYIGFFMFLLLAAYSIFLEYLYWIDWGRLKNEYPEDVSNNFMIQEDLNKVKI